MIRNMSKQLDLFSGNGLKLYHVKAGNESFIVSARSREDADLLVYMKQSDETYGNPPLTDYEIEEVPYQTQEGVLYEYETN